MRKCTIANLSDRADAILKGDAEVSKRQSLVMNNGFASYCTSFSATGVMRLMGADDRVFWSDETRSHKPFGSVSSHVADKVADLVTKAVEADKVLLTAPVAGRL